MKLLRFGEFGREKPGIELATGQRKDLSAHFADWNRDFFQSNGLAALRKLLDSGKNLPDVAPGLRHGSCVARPGKIVAIGLNYRDHAAESNLAVPQEPVIFFKAPNTTVGPYDDILIPRNSTKTDWEIELGVIIARDVRYLASQTQAADHIAGYCISHDVSEREFQLEHGGQWVKGKSCDTFNPLGPVLVTPDDIEDIANLDMHLAVNGETRQKGNTRNMVFGPHYLVYYLSQFMTLEAGDLITTGTPAGVGLGFDPPQFLQQGDVVSLTIDHLGSQRQQCRNA
ncbi:MAG: ureidoglycolate lyase [Chitinivibrionales bacterium]|nr:ureidoglycolate lyase [Chitinivibrionales bacterium]